MRIFLTGLLILLVCSCTTQQSFLITTSDAKYDSSEQSRTLGAPNKLSNKSVSGGINPADKGLFINPTVTRDNLGNIVFIGLAISHAIARDAVEGDANVLGAPQKLVFQLDGKTLELTVIGGKSQAGVVTQDGLDRAEVVENGIAEVTRQQFEQVVNSKNLAVTVVGSLQSVSYQQGDIVRTFVGNLRVFYRKVIKG